MKPDYQDGIDMNTPTQQTGGESATPRTDAEVIGLRWTQQGYKVSRPGIEEASLVPADFARQLERETATLHSQIARMKQRKAELVHGLAQLLNAPPDDWQNAANYARTLLQSVAKEGEQ